MRRIGAIWWWLWNAVTQWLHDRHRRRAVARCDRAQSRYHRARKRLTKAENVLRARDKDWRKAHRDYIRGGYDV